VPITFEQLSADSSEETPILLSPPSRRRDGSLLSGRVQLEAKKVPGSLS